MSTATRTFDPGCPSGLAPPSHEAGADLSAFVRDLDGKHRLQLVVRGAKCGGCLSKIEKSVSALPGVEVARLNLSTGHMDVSWTGSLAANRIGSTISELGYGVSARREDDGASAEKARERDLLISMAVAGFAMANIMLLSVSVWSGHGEMGDGTRQMMHAVSGLIALPVLAWSGRHFFASAWSVLKHGHANMDVPISLALLLAYGVSVWETATHGPHAYFDAVVMLLFFLLIGRFLDARLQRQAHAAAHDLAALQSSSVNRIGSNGALEAVPAADIRQGDKVLLAPGERAVIDLRILEGETAIDESMVTGESLPRQVGPGTVLYAGSVNIGQPLQGAALGEAADSLLADIGRMLDAGEQRRGAYRRIADRAVSLYVPFVHTTAALACLGWLLLGATLGDAIMIAVATLIITCPCALALAAPVAQVVAAGKLFRKGIYLRSGDALERLAETDHVVFDKTGTLTLGAPALQQVHIPSLGSPCTTDTPVSKWQSVGQTALSDAASLARASRHPLSRALVVEVGPGAVAAGVTEQPGLGLEAMVDGERWRLGSSDWVGAEQPGVAAQGPSLWFVRGDGAPILFTFSDEPREDAGRVVEALKARGQDIEILSGDRADAVASTASQLGVETWQAGASPQDKVVRLEALKAQGHKVLMVGDGLNDAGALSLAHASLAPGGAMDVSQSAADAVYGGGLESVPAILDIARSAKRVMLQNFGLAAAYNFIAVPIAVTGHVTPLVAAIAMSLSSLVVTLNALRIRG